MRPGKNGGQLRSGNPDATGRPRDAFKAMCAELADTGAKTLLARQVLENPDHPAFMGALKFVAEQAHGKPTQTIAGDPDKPLKLMVVREDARGGTA